MQFSESIFATRFNISRLDLENYLAEALAQGGDYADLYFEYLLTSSISIDESMVKSAAQGVSMGVGVRVIAGERTGYAYSDDLSPEKIRKAARVAAHGVPDEEARRLAILIINVLEGAFVLSRASRSTEALDVAGVAAIAAVQAALPASSSPSRDGARSEGW